MSLTITFTCQVDGLPCAVVGTTLKGEDRTARGEHRHLVLDDSFRCANGHAWTISGDLILERAQ